MDYNKAQSKKRELRAKLTPKIELKDRREIFDEINAIDETIELARFNGTLENAPKTLDQVYAKTVL